ncbi:MAG: Asparagine--tRNA ligase [Firmicutes bacterium ADurb.Bin248]|nr:MAG: Asparagine--tRNA ligase [Firmicutes bacterium ADurb.Bin248]HOG02235.1 asparagine--tRNA ligase [Clostridia bacterium]HPK16228.1 asparagine--tRNA ligase [Clostridia bacterium]
MPKLCELVRAPEAHKGPADVSGWIKTARESKNAGFIELSDGSCFKSVQVVYEPGRIPQELAKALGTGAAIRVRGELVLTPDMPQPFEIKADEIELLGACDEDYPLQKKRHTLEYMRTIQHLRPRANIFQATFRVRNAVAQSIHRFFDERGFLYVHTPLITPSDCEGAGEMFRVTTLGLDELPKTGDGEVDASKDFFGREANLTVSGQLYGEAFALAFRDIYTFGPTFRAEYSFTARHAAEFWMIEPEMAFCDLAGDMDLAEDMVKYVIRSVMERCPDELAFFNNFVDKGLLARLENVVNSEFARISYTEAVGLLKKSGAEFKYPVEWGCDLQTEHERYITEQVYGKPVFVTDYPKGIKAFYMRLNDDEQTVAAADLLVPGVGEIIGGSQREERLDVLKRRIAEMRMDVSQYGWYLDLRRFGGVKHAGFGLGFERILMYVTGMANIRDVLPFPRTTGSMEM